MLQAGGEITQFRGRKVGQREESREIHLGRCTAQRLSALNAQLRFSDFQLPAEPAFDSNNRIDGNLIGPPFPIGKLSVGVLPQHTQLVEGLPCGANEAAFVVENWVAR